MSGSRLIVTQQKTLAWYIGWGIVVLVALAVSYVAGRYFSAAERQEAIKRADFLQEELKKFQSAYQQVNEDLVMQTQSAKVDNQSSQQLVETVKRLQSVQNKLESELRFYRNIMAPELDKQGLTIAEFDIIEDSEKNSPRFKLVLTQAGKQEQFLKGNVDLKLKGKLAGVDKVYSFKELGTFQAKHFQFQFRYFQNIEGELSLPEGFIAEEVVIKARTHGLRKNQTAEKQVNWNS
ncbi:DUF6776 family protein [Aliikangiella sp. IMCC44359]|uniref:DUF6776 family protein n=1 Tax=Aliikangiella sp. IMCC44359 TaxID=3459125 RepID=UPI00403AD91F